jgi:hypothetical protein
MEVVRHYFAGIETEALLAYLIVQYVIYVTVVFNYLTATVVLLLASGSNFKQLDFRALIVLIGPYITGVNEVFFVFNSCFKVVFNFLIL